jgi:hypothetical protein
MGKKLNFNIFVMNNPKMELPSISVSTVLAITVSKKQTCKNPHKQKKNRV